VRQAKCVCGSVAVAGCLGGWGNCGSCGGPVADRLRPYAKLAASVWFTRCLPGRTEACEQCLAARGYRRLGESVSAGDGALDGTGTYVAEAWPEDRPHRWAPGVPANRLLHGASWPPALKFHVGAPRHWSRAVSGGLAPVIVALTLSFKARSRRVAAGRPPRLRRINPLRAIFSGANGAPHDRQCGPSNVSIVSLWAGTQSTSKKQSSPGRSRCMMLMRPHASMGRRCCRLERFWVFVSVARHREARVRRVSSRGFLPSAWSTASG